jgi:hypothetical protein
MHCTMLCLAHLYSYMLDCEEPTEQAKVKDLANLALDQGKPRFINQCSLFFILNLVLYYSWLCIKLIGGV